MLRFPAKKPSLGVEITASAVRLAVLSGRGKACSVLFTKTTDLPAGMVNESYTAPNIQDSNGLAGVIRESLSGLSDSGVQRAALSLPDNVFRVQTLDFDELPSKPTDRERLIRWRLEKSAFDIADTILRYHILRQQDKGVSVLACLVKQAVLLQYEEVLVKAGLEPWSVGISSFHALNFYASYLSKASPAAALAHVSEDSFTTIISESGETRFYRYKEIKRSGADGIKARLLREIDDSLHFYSHLDRTSQSTVERLYLSGNAGMCSDLATGLTERTSLDVHVLSPAIVLASANGVGTELTAALGAGCGI